MASSFSLKNISILHLLNPDDLKVFKQWPYHDKKYKTQGLAAMAMKKY